MGGIDQSSQYPMTPRELERFWSYVIKTDSCWPWMGHSIPSGYGRFTLKGRQRPAHRMAYELTHDLVVAKELVMDHLCRNPPCVNPAHLEPISNYENSIFRSIGNPASINHFRTECKSGHAFDEANTAFDADGHRRCRACRREFRHRQYWRKKGEAK